MKFKLTEDQERKLEQFARSNFSELFIEILRAREKQLNELFRCASSENFLEVKGRALEVESLIVALKIKESTGD